MTGVGILLLLLIWAIATFAVSSLICNHFFQWDKTEFGSKFTFTKLILTLFLFFLPVTDEVISYPSYLSLCEDGGKYKFAKGMNKESVKGREYYAVDEVRSFTLFPTYNDISSPVDDVNGVVIELRKTKIFDTNTGELLIHSNSYKPVKSFFAIPWDGVYVPWLLKECSNYVGRNGQYSQNLLRDLKLRRTISLEEIIKKRGKI